MATKPLEPEEKRVRGLTKAQLVDAIGTAKAAIADAEGVVERLKAEAIRRKYTDEDGALFHITVTPPGESVQLDTKLVRAVFAPEFVTAQLSKTVQVGYVLRCNARTGAAAQTAIAAAA